MTTNDLPIAIIGGGPVGLAAAAHLSERQLPFVLIEAGSQVGHNVLDWGHVQLFSPWSETIDHAAARLLVSTGWEQPTPAAYPSGQALVERYLAPLAAHPAIAPHLRLNRRVTAITRVGVDKLTNPGREQAPFVLHVAGPHGQEDTIVARAVIDASGSWSQPNPLGAGGVPAPGERVLATRIFYGIPDVLGKLRERYAGKRVLVAGSGHSAFNAILDLAALAAESPGTQITWVVRRGNMERAYGGGANDALPARGALGQRVRALIERGVVQLVSGWRTERLLETSDGIVVTAGEHQLAPVDEIVVATGLRPDLTMLRELRLSLDPAVEAPTTLAPLIDPNFHSCGSVRPHGVDELTHPEPNFYIVGMKSYGRAPTFLLLTGYEQVRSVAAALAGDWEAARRVELILPETGVCSGPVAAGGEVTAATSCCGPVAAAPTRTETIDLASVTSRSAIALTPVSAPAAAITLMPVAAGPDTVSCCASDIQATCCEPEAKDSCCGGPASTSSSCGCQ